MAKSWMYTQTPGQKVGLMICTACNGHISEGQFRYRTTEEAHLPQHRACSADDPQWEKLDAKADADKRFEERRQASYAAFVAEFGHPHDLIEDEDPFR